MLTGQCRSLLKWSGTASSLDYSRVTPIDGRALRIGGNGSPPWSGLQIEFVERAPEKNPSAAPSTKTVIEALRPCAFAPAGLPVNRRTVVVIPRKMKNS